MNAMTPAKRFVREHYPDAWLTVPQDGSPGYVVFRFLNNYDPSTFMGKGRDARQAWEAAERHVRREQKAIGGTG